MKAIEFLHDFLNHESLPIERSVLCADLERISNASVDVASCPAGDWDGLIDELISYGQATDEGGRVKIVRAETAAMVPAFEQRELFS